jgi:hypothetical protein
MTVAASVPVLAFGAAWSTAGFGFGLAYFAAMRRSVEIYVAGGARLIPAILTLGRIAAAFAFLGLAATAGALPLLAAFIGFLAARMLALRTARRMA